MPLSNAELLEILYNRMTRLTADRAIAKAAGDDAAVEALDADITVTEGRISDLGGPPWMPPEGGT